MEKKTVDGESILPGKEEKRVDHGGGEKNKKDPIEQEVAAKGNWGEDTHRVTSGEKKRKEKHALFSPLAPKGKGKNKEGVEKEGWSTTRRTRTVTT